MVSAEDKSFAIVAPGIPAPSFARHEVLGTCLIATPIGGGVGFSLSQEEKRTRDGLSRRFLGLDESLPTPALTESIGRQEAQGRSHAASV